ncbi:hypothetical protein D3C72_1396440 [compost metagenome]
MADEFDDVALDRAFGGAGHAHRLVQHDVHVAAGAWLAGSANAQRLAVDQYLVILADHRAGAGGMAIDGDPAGGDQAIGLATGAEAGVGDVFVESAGHHPIIRHHRPSRLMPWSTDLRFRHRTPGCGHCAWPRTWRGRRVAATRPGHLRPAATVPGRCSRSPPDRAPADPGRPR